MSDTTSDTRLDTTSANERRSGPRPGAVVPLNDAAAVYQALAEQIRGSAVGWPDHALAKLEAGLLDRYGPVLGGRHPVRRLVRLAATPATPDAA